jgi:hypothetical protein
MKENIFKRALTGVVILGLILVSIGLAYQLFHFFKDKDEQASLTMQEAVTLVEGADVLTFKGDGDALFQKPTIWVDNQNVGMLVEKGIIHQQLQLFAGSERYMYVQYDDTTLSDARMGSTYACFNDSEEVLGYGEESLVALEGASDKVYVYLFYDENKKRVPYYAVDNYYNANEEKWTIYSNSGEILCKADYDYNSISSEYEMILKSYDNQVALEDKLILLNLLLQNVSANFPEY